jgi:cyclopropane-fatty-acyl-phospholipid synthase
VTGSSTATQVEVVADPVSFAESVSPSAPVADVLAPLLRTVLGDPLPVRFECWDASAIGPSDGPGLVRFQSPDALRRVLWAPGDLGLARAYVTGDLAVVGDLFAVLRRLGTALPGSRRSALSQLAPALRAALRLGLLGPPPARPTIEALPHGRVHSKIRDAQVVRHHYDIGNDFYRLVLGPTLTYSCARFDDKYSTLEEAQTSKHELICRKLGLDQRRGARLLDVGCGWGSLALHAAQRYEASVLGVTLSPEQGALARQRADEAGLADLVEIEVMDYRDLVGQRFDAIASVGMSEHVGKAETQRYFTTLRGLLAPEGRLLNHAISTVGGSKIRRRSFVGRYVFPDGELLDVGDVVLAMERAGFEVRDVESLREHYVRTLRSWVENLETHWDEAVAAVGLERARVWRLYMAASANRFEQGELAVHQVLGVVSNADGRSGMPPTREGWSLTTEAA